MSYLAPGRQSEKKYTLAVVFAAVFGTLGIHYFYIGRTIIGFIDLALSISALIFFIQGRFFLAMFLFFIDFLHSMYATYKLLTGQEHDGEGEIITYPGQIKS